MTTTKKPAKPMTDRQKLLKAGRLKFIRTPAGLFEVEFSTRHAIKSVWDVSDDLFEEEQTREDILPLFEGKAREHFLNSLRHAINQQKEMERLDRTQEQVANQAEFVKLVDEFDRIRQHLAGNLGALNNLRSEDPALRKLLNNVLHNMRMMSQHLSSLDRFDSPNPKRTK